MKMFINIFGARIPMYGLMIVLGIATANLLAYLVLKKKKMDFDDFVIVEAFGGGMGFLGAKLLYLWVSRDMIDWSRFFEKEYFGLVMQGGFVFYGGVILGIPAAIWFGKINKIKTLDYMQHIMFLIPWCHGFGRIGCFCGGCCYGVPYDGPIAVVYPKATQALIGMPNVPLFPVQLVEAICLFVLSGILFFMYAKLHSRFVIEAYLILYAIIRFVLEDYRYDAARGYLGPLSTSQWISIGMAVIGIASIIIRVILGKKKAVSGNTENAGGAVAEAAESAEAAEKPEPAESIAK